MPTRAVSSQHILLQRDTSDPPFVVADDGADFADGSYETIAEILNFSGPNETAKQIEVTSVDSSAHEYISGLIDAGSMTFSGNFVGLSSSQQGVHADIRDRLVRAYTLLLTDNSIGTDQDADPGSGGATRIVFNAAVVKFGIKGSVDKQIEFDAELKITGPATFTYHVDV